MIKSCVVKAAPLASPQRGFGNRSTSLNHPETVPNRDYIGITSKRNMAVRSLTPEAWERCKDIRKKHGAQEPFLTKSGVDRKTFKRLAKEGYASVDVVERVEAALMPDKREVTPESIVLMVANEYGVTTLALKAGEAREARQIAAFALTKETRLSMEEIGAQVGMARTGVIGAIQSLTDRMDTERPLFRKVWSIIAKIKS